MPRALGGDHDDVVAGLGLDVAEADVEAVPEDEGSTLGEVRGDLLGVHMTLDLVRREDDDDVGALDGLRDGQDAQALVLGLLAGRRALAQADGDVDAGVAQVERVGVALAPVADDGNLAASNDGQISVVVVEQLSHRRSPWLDVCVVGRA